MSKLEIYIVEDNQTMRDGLEQVLDLLGHNVTVFDKAEAGWSGIEKKQPQILIADYKLPGMNGLDFIGKVKNSWPGS